jgi:hypothetical protein
MLSRVNLRILQYRAEKVLFLQLDIPLFVITQNRLILATGCLCPKNRGHAAMAYMWSECEERERMHGRAMRQI